MSLSIDLAACVMSGGENSTSGCHLAVFSVEIAFACTSWLPTTPPNRNACGVGYPNKMQSKMAESLAIHSVVSTSVVST